MSFFGVPVSNSLSLGLGGSVSLNGANASSEAPQFPKTLYQNGEQGFFYPTWNSTYLFKDTAGTMPVTAEDDPVALIVDDSGVGINATQATLGNRPLFKEDAIFGQSWVAFNTNAKTMVTGSLPALSDDSYVFATRNGVVEYKVTKGSGTFSINVQGAANREVVGAMIIDRSLTPEELTEVYDYFVANGSAAAGGDAYAGVTDFSSAWNGWSFLSSFPIIDTPSGTTFSSAWFGCSGLTSFPAIDTSSGTNFSSAWRGCTGLTSFPVIDTSSGTNFSSTWRGCTGLTSFPVIDTSSGTNFSAAWRDCTSLATFDGTTFAGTLCVEFTGAFINCALSQASVDSILVALNANGETSGYIDITGGTNSPPSATGEAAIDALRAKFWVVNVAGGY